MMKKKLSVKADPLGMFHHSVRAAMTDKYKGFFRPYNPKKLARKKLDILFIVSIAIQKFQKIQSDKLKKSLSYQFDREAALREIKALFAKEVKGEDKFRLLAYYVRKFELTFNDLPKKLVSTLWVPLKEEDRFLCSALKFLLINSEDNPIKPSMVIDLAKTKPSSECMMELFTHLVDNLDKVKDKEGEELLQALLALPELGAEPKAFFISKLDRKKGVDNEKEESTRSLVPRKVKKNQQAVSKTMQTVRARQMTNSQTSEEDQANFDFLQKAAKRNQMTKRAMTRDEGDEEEKQESGSDQSWLKGTWREVRDLYSNTIHQGKPLKDDEKDAYVPNKLFGWHAYPSDLTLGWNSITFDEKKVCSFFINRMCVAMLLKASQKQKLEKKAIGVLTKCITDFDGLLDLLDLKKEKVLDKNFFVKTVLKYYWNFEPAKLTEPDLATDFVRRIADAAGVVQEVNPWYRPRYKKATEKSEYDRAELKEFIVDEINKVRVSAVKALCESAKRYREETLTGKLLNKVDDYLDKGEDGGLGGGGVFREHVLELQARAEELEGFDYAKAFNSYHRRLKINRSSLSAIELKSYLRFMKNQVVDSARTKELFTSDVMDTLIVDSLPNLLADEERARDIVEIVYTFLGHESTACLEENQLNEMIKVCQLAIQEGASGVLVLALLTVFLYSVEKRTRTLQKMKDKGDDRTEELDLAKRFLDELVRLYTLVEGKEDAATSILVFVINRLLSSNDLFIGDKRVLEHISKKMHKADSVKVDDDSEEEKLRIVPDDKNCHFGYKISFHASHVLLRSAEQKVHLTSKTVDNLVIVLSGSENDKQTKIAAAKCLYAMAKSKEVNNDDYLNRLLDLFEQSTVYDIGVYLKSAYSNGCREVSGNSKDPIRSIHLESMSKTFVSEELLKLGQKDFKEEINENVLDTLLSEAKKQKSEFKDADLFKMFNKILAANEKYSEAVLKILSSYSNKFSLPVSLVRTLEDLLSSSGSQFEKALSILKNVILDGKVSVTDKTFKVYSGHLRSSTNARLRFDSFRLVERVGQNQELPNEIFAQVELVRAAFALEMGGNKDDAKDLLNFIQRSVDAGVKLPMDTKSALKKEIQRSSESVLGILVTMAKNNEIIDATLLQRLSKMFDPSDKSKDNVNILLIRIFEHVSKNNQSLDASLLRDLEMALLKEKRLKESVLPVFVYLAQKGQRLSAEVMSELIGRLKHADLLSAAGSMIEANYSNMGKGLLSKIHEILLREIKSESQNVRKLCLRVISKWVKVSGKVEEDILKEVVRLGTDANKSNDAIRVQVKEMFDNVMTGVKTKHMEEYRMRIRLANLKAESAESLIEQLISFQDDKTGENVLLAENFKQLRDVLNHGGHAHLRMKVLELLLNSKDKRDITDDLLESVAILHKSSTSDQLQASCLSLLDKVVKDGKTLKGQAQQLSLRDKRLEKFLKSSAAKELKRMQIEPHELAPLFGDDEEFSSKIKNLSGLLHFVWNETDLEAYAQNEAFVTLIEHILMKEKGDSVVEISLEFYSRIMLIRRECEGRCFQALAAEGRSFKGKEFFKCMFYASSLIRLPQNCLRVVEENLNNEDERVRGFAFDILRRDPRCKSIFLEYCNVILTSLERQIGISLNVDEDTLDLLANVVSVKYLDTEVFNASPRADWRRDILLSDIANSIKPKLLPTDRVQMNMSWLAVQERFGSNDSMQVLALIQKSSFQDFRDLIKVLSLIPDLSVNGITWHLLGSSNPAKSIEEFWCFERLTSKLSDDSVAKAYLKTLAKKLCLNFTCFDISRMLTQIKSIDNMFAFEDILDFCLREKIKFGGDKVMMTLDETKAFVESKYLCDLSKSRPEDPEQEQKLFTIFKGLKESGWTLEEVREVVQTFDRGFKNLLNFLSTVVSYSLPPSNVKRCKAIATKATDFEDMLRQTNELMVENHFQSEGKAKDPNELLAEIASSGDPDLSKAVKNGEFDIEEKIFKAYKEQLSWTEKPILIWAMEWAKVAKDTGETFSDYEGIAVILRANNLITGHTLTHTQILCCLIALRGTNSKLMQVSTGEGKSTITCILAIINALRGKKVDVITSSPVLAERDAKEKAQLYRFFNLTCTDNNDKTEYLKGKKDCYDADVVYGEMAQFQFDILRDNYSQLGTMGDRRCQVAIVDEVDSMLIDDGSKIARLSTTVPGMDHFQPIYVFLWQRLDSLRRQFIVFGGDKMFFLRGKVGFRNDKLVLQFADEDGQLMQIDDLEGHIEKETDWRGDDDVCVLVDDFEDFLKRELEGCLEERLKELYIPSNFAKLVERQKPKWVANAIEALNYQENIHYVVDAKSGQVKPVDFNSTGIVQSSTVWSDGLHQFLQLKHNLKMTSETLTTNFLSNLGFVDRYERLFGLSGTLGSKAARTVLKEIYQNVDIVDIPSRREKQFYEFKSAIRAKGEDDWLAEVLSHVTLETRKGRGCLVICETIEQANLIHRRLKSRIASVKLYTMNGSNQEKDVSNIRPREVIVATNLAGRGTDIRTDKIEETGGLHVVITFMPNNQRVEDQAFGRTARQGKRGTGVLILNTSDEIGIDVKTARDRQELAQLEDFRDKDSALIRVKDKLFDTFCNFLNYKVRLKVREENRSAWSKFMGSLKELVPEGLDVASEAIFSGLVGQRVRLS